MFKPARKNPEILTLNKDRSILKKEWNRKEFIHDSIFIKGLISKEKYFSIKKSNKLKRVSDFRLIAKKRKELSIQFSFNGRNSFHYWLWVFGVFLTMFVVSIFSAMKDARLHKKGLLKWYEPHSSIVFITISLFWLFHTIFKSDYDFQLNIYLMFLLCVLFPISYFIYHFIRRVFIIEDKLLENIRNLVSHVLKNTKEEKEDEKWDLLEKVADNGK